MRHVLPLAIDAATSTAFASVLLVAGVAAVAAVAAVAVLLVNLRRHRLARTGLPRRDAYRPQPLQRWDLQT